MIDNECFEKVGFFLSARDLKKMDTFSNTDPYAIVYLKDSKSNQMTRVGITDCIMDSQNPDWPSHFIINYYFEQTQEVTVRIYDRDGNYPLDKVDRHHEFAGEVSFNISTLMCNKGQELALNLARGKSGGTCIIRAETVGHTRDIFTATFTGIKLINVDGIFGMFGKSDPFLRFFKLYENGSFSLCYETKVIMDNLNPNWGKLSIPMVSLCNGDPDRPIKIEVWDWESSGRHKPMGAVETSVRGLVDAGGNPFDIIEQDKKNRKKGYVNSGRLAAQNAFIEQHPTFTDFIMGGLEVSLMVAIDFTASNGPPYDASSLHFVNPNGMVYNQYQQAIVSVGRILEDYDHDKMYPVYGFGAKVRMPDGSFSPVQHCFPVYGGGLEVNGVHGILQAYQDGIANVALSGPTLFGPLINSATGFAANMNVSQHNQKYAILLIITDGEINDMAQAINAIVAASRQPLSIIIIGVGSADFSNMVQLDSDNQLLRGSSGTAERDIVQFVSYREVSNKGPQALAQEVLAEVPNQVLRYFTARGIRPNPRRC